jgi:hypothetical protein
VNLDAAYVVCESVAAITPHARRVDAVHPVRLSGHGGDVHALCGARIAWDTRLPIDAVQCTKCRDRLVALEVSFR